jgi:hypothetical protein
LSDEPSSFFLDGAAAARAGHLITHNPYKGNDFAFGEWINGYYSVATSEHPNTVIVNRDKSPM